jgi:hypothetical protein
MRKSLRFAVLLATWFAAFLAIALILAPPYAAAQPHPGHLQPHATAAAMKNADLRKAPPVSTTSLKGVRHEVP